MRTKKNYIDQQLVAVNTEIGPGTADQTTIGRKL